MRKILLNIFMILFLLSIQQNSFAYNDTIKLKDSVLHEGKFNPGEFIFDHIKDSYEWHLFSYKGHHYAIPLPVILYSKQKGLICFSSKKIGHAQTYKGFRIASKGRYDGKIIEVNKQGQFIARPLDISLTKDVAAIIFSGLLMIFLFVSVARTYLRNPNEAPKGLQSLLEPLILFVRDDIAKNSIGEKNYEKYTPFLLTIFFFILMNNLLGLIPIFPGGANVTGNITVTMSLALLTFIITPRE